MRASTETTAPAATIISRARATFGPDGAGLRMTSLGMLDVAFESAVASIVVRVEPLGRGLNQVEIESRELESEAMRFLRQLPSESLVARLRRRLRS